MVGEKHLAVEWIWGASCDSMSVMYVATYTDQFIRFGVFIDIQCHRVVGSDLTTAAHKNYP